MGIDRVWSSAVGDTVGMHFHDDQDMQAAKGMWIGVKNFYDPVKGVVYPHKVIS